MYSFMNDYSEGAHPRILELMLKANFEQNTGYGEDRHSRRAAGYIRHLLEPTKADIHFIPGGTQTNLIVIAAALRPHQCVISAETGHINVHETGAIEATGHKVVAIPTATGKLTTEAIQKAVEHHSDEHMVQPKMVYISNSTELGTIYSKAELQALHDFCHSHDLLLFLDGARLGSALTAAENDLNLADVARLTDVFYIGGTKNGALLGEALVISHEELKRDFRFIIKQRGALLAKGFVTGMQFEALFADGLFFELAAHANKMAAEIAEALTALKIPFYAPPQSNQLFPILPDEFIERLSHKFAFSRQARIKAQHRAIRLVTSWATTAEGVEALITALKRG